MTYKEYILNWESNFGDADTGEYGYWRGSRYFQVEVHRLSEAEFDRHIAALDSATAKFDVAHANHNHRDMMAALEEGLPHEVALVI